MSGMRMLVIPVLDGVIGVPFALLRGATGGSPWNAVAIASPVIKTAAEPFFARRPRRPKKPKSIQLWRAQLRS